MNKTDMMGGIGSIVSSVEMMKIDLEAGAGSDHDMLFERVLPEQSVLLRWAGMVSRMDNGDYADDLSAAEPVQFIPNC